MRNATPYRLEDGSWGALVEPIKDGGSLYLGASLQITTRSGKSWATNVDKVIERRQDGTAIVSVKKTPPVSAARGTGYSWSALRHRGL